jgi:hypothetical protein
MRIFPIGIALIAGLVLSGCAREMVYLRIDGQRGSTDPVLAQQFEIDRTICQGEMQRANVSGVTFTGGGIAGAVAAAERSNAVGQVAQGCMAQKGYVAVPKEQAEAKQAELIAVAEEKKRREQVANAPVIVPRKPKQSASVGN